MEKGIKKRKEKEGKEKERPNNDNNNNNNNNNDNNNDNNNNNNNNNNVNNDDKDIAFSRYHNKNNRDFAFEDLYPDYNKVKVLEYNNNNNNNNNNTVKDYSEFDGYSPNDICYKCKCLTREDGYTFCGKQIPGMGVIGCSSRWNCRNCKKCKEPSNSRPSNLNKVNDYNCKSCKCIETRAGKICGRRSKIDGYISKCNSECKNCDKCYGKKYGSKSNNSSNDNKYTTVKPLTSLKRVIVNNITNKDLDELIN